MNPISEKYGIETKEQAEELIDTMIDNIAGQITVVSAIAAENGIDGDDIPNKIIYLCNHKRTEYLKETIESLADFINEHPEILEDHSTGE